MPITIEFLGASDSRVRCGGDDHIRIDRERRDQATQGADFTHRDSMKQDATVP
jgi:hypothetical protein